MFQRRLVRVLMMSVIAINVLGGRQVVSRSVAAEVVEPKIHQRVYVDPKAGADNRDGLTEATTVRTIQKARDLVRGIAPKMTGDVHVVLMPGTHVVATPIELGPQDSGQNGHRIVYTTATPAQTLVSGGVELGKWELHDRDANIWRSDLPKPVMSRSLIVDGMRARRAHLDVALTNVKIEPTLGYLCDDQNLLSIRNASDAELVFRQIWTSPRVGIQSVERIGDRVLLRMQNPGFANAQKKGITSIGTTPWLIENAYEFLDEEGEWYLDRTGAISGTANRVFYKPYPWQDMSKVRAVLPTSEGFFTLNGTAPSTPVTSITFRSIPFKYTTWHRPNRGFGVSDAQNNVMREQITRLDERLPDAAAIAGRYVRDITVEECSFEHLGSVGVMMRAGSQRITVEGNRLVDIASTGIQFGDYTEFENPASENHFDPADPDLRLADLRIANNYLRRCGSEYRSATGIAWTYPINSVIAHNEIHDMPYSGVHLGWAWQRAKRTAAGGNRIEFNRVENTMVELADGGAFYTLGRTNPDLEPTIIRGNYAKQTRWGQGFYFDESSSHYRVTDNVAEDIGDFNVKVNGPSADIKVSRMFAQHGRTTIAKEAVDCAVDPAIMIDDSVRDVVEAIKDKAGLEPAFDRIRPDLLDRPVHEAEDAEVSGGTFATSGIGTGVRGYRGMGFADGLNRRDTAQIVFPVNVSKAGRYRVIVRYSQWEAPAPLLIVSVNGTVAQTLPTELASAKGEWKTVETSIELKEGKNDVALKLSQTGKPAFLVDQLQLVHE